MRMHLTLSGPLAGSLVCGKSRESAKNDGEGTAHYITTPDRVLDVWRSEGRLCEVCDRMVSE